MYVILRASATRALSCFKLIWGEVAVARWIPHSQLMDKRYQDLGTDYDGLVLARVQIFTFSPLHLRKEKIESWKYSRGVFKVVFRDFNKFSNGEIFQVTKSHVHRDPGSVLSLPRTRAKQPSPPAKTTILAFLSTNLPTVMAWYWPSSIF